MAYNTPETVADYLARFQMEITHRGKGTFTPDHVKYSLTIASGGKDFFTTFESNPHVHGEPTITQVFGALASDAMVVRDYGMDEFVDEFCDGMKPSAAIRAYNSCKETYDWMRDGLYLSNGDIASLSEVISENEEEIGALVEKAASERAARYAYDHPKLPKGFVTIEQLQGDLDLGDLRDEVEDFDFDGDITEAFGIRSMTTTMPFSRGFPTTRSGWKKPSSTAFSKAARAISTRWFRWRSTCASSPTSTTIAMISAVTAPSTS